MSNSMGKALYSMRVRLALVCVITTGVLLCAMATVLLRISENQMELQSDAAFRNSANSIVYRLQNSRIIDDAWLSQIEAGSNLIVHIEDNTYPILFRGSWSPETSRGRLVSLAHEKAMSEYLFDVKTKPYSALATEEITFDVRGNHDELYKVFISLIPKDAGWQSLTLLKDLEKENRTRFLLRVSFFAVIFASLVLLLLFSLLFSKRATVQVEDANKKHVEFIAAASHELRAPLTVVKASVAESAKEQVSSHAEKYHTIAEREIRRMARLIDELLLLANADAEKLTLKSGTVDFDTILTELYENYEVIARSKKQHLTLSLPDNALPIISGDKQRLAQAFTAILDNAVSYTPENGHISVEAIKSKRTLSIVVSDDGPGIPDCEKARVFERFKRSDSAHADKDHYGLGLSVAKEIIEMHNGKITVSDSSAGGALFTIRFLLH
ncbi:MAG: HAMP domain-containing histidine kinase [Clostridiales bacterium]|nr:HAMP domain-containing histidine kinase [Clostridiales bacterium]